MDIDKCRILLEAVDCGSLSAAASKLGYTTAGISYNVDAIENELGFPIIKRGHSGITLTSNGKKIVPLLRELIQVESKLERRAHELRKLFNGEITVGAFSSIAKRLMPRIIAEFQKEYPDVSITIHEGVLQELESLLLQNEVDFCFCSYHEEYKFQWIPLRNDPMVCVIPEGHPLAALDEIRPEQLRNEPLIMPGYGKDLDAVELLKRFDVEPNVKYSTVETETSFAMVAHGFGIVITNELTIGNEVKGTVVRPFVPRQHVVEGVYIDSIESASPLTKRLIKFLENYFKNEVIEPL